MLIRNMDYADIDFACYCTNNEGWISETKEVFESLISFNPKGCFVAEKDSKRIGIGVATQYKTNGFIGELVVIKEMRNHGYGSKLFEHAIQYLRSNGTQNICLDADLTAVPLYEQYGFKKVTRSLRFLGKITARTSALVKRATQNDINKMCEIDTKLFGDDRSYFLRRRHNLFPHLCLVLKIENLIGGYIFGRPGINAISVVPLAVLLDAINPLELLQTLAVEEPTYSLSIGVLENNRKAVEFFRSLQSLKEKEPCWRMVLGPSAYLGLSEKLYTIGSGAKG